MKKSIPFFFALLSSLLIQSCEKNSDKKDQSKELIFAKNFEWQIIKESMDFSSPAITSIQDDTITYFIKGDTLIDNKIYKQINFNMVSGERIVSEDTNYIISSSASGGILGYYRSDIDKQVVYYRNSFEKNESILYNFNLGVGDTLEYQPNEIYTRIVKSIDTLNIGSYELKRINIESIMWGRGDFIIGIGSSTGLPNFGFNKVNSDQITLVYFEIEGERYNCEDINFR
jgi:hypothetical protein